MPPSSNASRWAARRNRRTLPAPRCSWRARRPATSPAPACWWTAPGRSPATPTCGPSAPRRAGHARAEGTRRGPAASSLPISEGRKSAMPKQISGEFDVRREAELAVERLVQEYKIDRSAIQVAAAGDDNTAGTVASGADRDRETGEPGESPTHGRIRGSGTGDDAGADKAQEALRQGPRI